MAVSACEASPGHARKTWSLSVRREFAGAADDIRALQYFPRSGGPVNASRSAQQTGLEFTRSRCVEVRGSARALALVTSVHTFLVRAPFGHTSVVSALVGALGALPATMQTALPADARHGAWERYGIMGHALEQHEYSQTLAALKARVARLAERGVGARAA